MRLAAAIGALVITASACSAGSGGRAVPPNPPPTAAGAVPPSVNVQGVSYSASSPCGWRTSTTYRHVVWIWMENRTYASVVTKGSHLASYAARCGLATQYYAVTHPSLPNYLAASSGSTGGVTRDCDPA